MAFYNRDNVFTRAKQAKKRIHIDLKQDDQAADILSAPHIPHREAESEKALNHTPKHEALFDTDDPIHCKRKRGEDTTVKPADDSSEDSNNSLPTFSHQEQYLEPKIETVIESTVETIRPLNDNFEDRVQFNQEYVSTKATQVMKRKEDDSEQDIQLLQENTDTATSTELHLRASVIEKSSEDIQSNVLRAGSSTEKRVEGIAHRPAEDSVQETLPTMINPNSRLHPPDLEVHSTTRTTYDSGKTVEKTFVNHVSYNRDNVFTKAKKEKRRYQSNLEGKNQIHHRTVDIPTGSELHLDAVDNEFNHTSYLGMQYDIDDQTSLKKQACEVDDSVNSVDSRLTFSSVVPTDPVLNKVANKMSSSSDTPSTIHEQIIDGCGYSYKKTENCSLHESVEPTHLENSQICGDWSLISLSNVPSLYTDRMGTSKPVDSLKPETENVDYFIRTTKSKCQDPTDMIDFESDSSLQPQNTTPTLDNAETQLQIRNSNVFGEETNTTMSSGNTKANRILYNRDNVFTKAKQQKRRNQSNLEGKDQLHHRIAEVLTDSGVHFDAVDNEFKHTTYLEGQYGINGRSSMTQHAWEVDDLANTVGSRLTSSSVLPKDPVLVEVPNDMSSPSNTANIMNATTSSGNTSVNRVLYNRDNVFTRAKQEKRRNQKNLEERPQIHYQTADIPTGSGLHLDAVDNEFMHTSYLGVQPDKSSMKKQKMEVDDSVNSIDPRLNLSSVVPTDAVFDKVQNETGLSFKTSSIMNATTSSGNTSVNRVLYNRDNVFTRAKQEKRRNQRNLEEKPQIHHQTADIPTGSGLHLDAVDNEFMHTSYLGVQPDKSSMKKQKMEVDDSVNSIDSRLNLSSEIHQTADIPTGSGLHLDAVDNEFMHTSYLGVQPDISSMKKQKMEVDDSVNSIDPRLNISSIVPTDAVFDKVQNETGLSFETGSIILKQITVGCEGRYREAENCSQHESFEQANLENSPNCDDWSLISLSNVPSLYTGQMDTSKPADTFKPEVENFDSFVHIRTTKSKCQDPTDLIAFDSDSSLPYDMNHRIKENLRSNEQETPEKMAFSQIYMQQTENHTTIAAGVIMNLNSVPIIGHFQTEIPALPPTPFKHLVTPQIDVTESQVKSNSNSGYTKVKQQRNPNHSDMPPIWDYGLHPQNITATLDNADTQLQPSTTEKRTDAVRGTVLSGATNAALPSGNTYVNHVSYNRDNVFTRAKQEKRRNQNNLEGRGQIHHQTVDIPAGSEMQHDTIHNEFKHTPYLDVQYDIGGRSSMMKPEWNVDNSIKHNDSLTFSSMVPTNTAIDKVPNEIGSSSKNASTINSVALPINVNDNQANFNHDDGYTKVNQPRNRHSNMTKWDNRLQPQNNAITLGNAQTPTAGQRTEGVRSNAQGEATSTKHIKIRDNWTSGAKLEHPRKQTGITNAPRPQQQPPPSRKIRSNDPQSRTRLDPNCGHAEPNRPSSSSVPPRSTNYITETRASNRERRKVGCFQCAIL